MTADLSTLTDDALNLRLAEHCGWRKLDNGEWLEERNGGGRRHYQDPKFTASVDALLAPGGPIERCRERGWDYWTVGAETPDGKWYEAQIYQSLNPTADTRFWYGLTPARALALAACAALEATE